MIIFAVYLARIRVYEEGDLKLLEGQSFTPLVVNFMYKRRVAEVLLDLCLIPLAYYTAYRLRFEGLLFATNYQFFIQSLPLVIVAQLIAMFVVGGYRGTWRYFGMMDAVTFAKGVVLGTVAAQIVILYLYRFESYSRAVFVIDAALLMLLLSGSRASFRLVARVHSPPDLGRAALRHLRHQRREPRHDPRGLRRQRVVEDSRFHRRRSGAPEDARRRVFRARRLSAAAGHDRAPRRGLRGTELPARLGGAAARARTSMRRATTSIC